MSAPSSGRYPGSVVGTVAKGACNIEYSGQVQDQWTGAVSVPNEGTLWSLGSCAKSFTATLFGILATQPLPSVAPDTLVYPLIEQYLPAGLVPAALQTITLEQLASMTAGLPSEAGSPLDAVSTLFAELMKPGLYGATSFLYSNLSYALLSFALVAAAGLAPPEMSQLPAQVFALMQSGIFTPLGMSSATFYPPQQNAAYNFPYGNSTTGVVNGGKSDWPAYDGAGALYMTAPDLMKWLVANMQGAAGPLGQAATFVQSDPVSTHCWLEGQFVLRGWFAKTYQGGGGPLTMVDKNGDIAGFHCGVAFLEPETPGAASDYGVFVACNFEQDTIPLMERGLSTLISNG